MVWNLAVFYHLYATSLRFLHLPDLPFVRISTEKNLKKNVI